MLRKCQSRKCHLSWGMTFFALRGQPGVVGRSKATLLLATEPQQEGNFEMNCFHWPCWRHGGQSSRGRFPRENALWKYLESKGYYLAERAERSIPVKQLHPRRDTQQWGQAECLPHQGQRCGLGGWRFKTAGWKLHHPCIFCFSAIIFLKAFSKFSRSSYLVYEISPTSVCWDLIVSSPSFFF